MFATHCYTVVVFDGEPDFAVADFRLVAICSTVKQAQDIVKRNSGDIYEGSYRYAVIEKIALNATYGIGPASPFPAEWYRWDGSWEDGGYVSCLCPEQYRNIVCWAF